MEINLSLPELEAILEAGRRQNHNRNKFAAALKGISLDDNEEPSQDKFDAIERRANAKAAGVSEEAYEFSDLGIGVETE